MLNRVRSRGVGGSVRDWRSSERCLEVYIRVGVESEWGLAVGAALYQNRGEKCHRIVSKKW